MREFTIGKNDAGQRLDRFVAKNLPLLPPALLQKYIRLKRIKVNGKGSKRDVRLETGDILQLYINDEFFDKPNEENLFLTVFKPQLNIVYEDENLLLVDKRPGMSVHADETEKVNTLINHIQAYLYQKREWNPKWENAFAPALCNRIDRNTGGIVIAAKNAETLRIINEKTAQAAGGKNRGLSAEKRGQKGGPVLPQAGARRQDRRHPLPDSRKPGRTVSGGMPSADRPHPPDPRLHGGDRLPPAGGRQVRQGRCEPPLS